MSKTIIPPNIEKGAPVWMWATQDDYKDAPQWISGVVVSVWPSGKGAVVRWNDDSSQDDYPLDQLQFTPPALTVAPVGGSTPHCHYCGSHATAFNFFDVPVCPQCGG